MLDRSLRAEHGAADVVEAGQAVDVSTKVGDADERGGARELVLELVDALAVEVGQDLELGGVVADRLGERLAGVVGSGREGRGEVAREHGERAV